MARYKINDHVNSRSGLVYVVLELIALDDHGSFAYRVRRLRGGVVYGPTRIIEESALYPDYQGHVGLQHP